MSDRPMTDRAPRPDPVRIRLRFGALAPALLQQLTEQGLTADAETIACWQKDADAICWCRIRGLVAESITKRAEHRLAKRILHRVGGDVAFSETTPKDQP